VAINGKEAVEAFRESQKNGSKYNLICMDIMMAEMDGQTAVCEIRPGGSERHVIHKRTKIIMVTALDDVKNVVKSFKALCDAYLFKPVDTVRLVNHLKTLALIS
jgi:two-component system chemotaxis response regulator CheY